MSRYIDRDAVRRAIQEYCFSPKEITPDGIAKVVMNVPPADVVEVRHGEWITPKSRDADDWKECSRCGYYFDVSVGDTPTPYCPNCGAKMDGERKENE